MLIFVFISTKNSQVRFKIFCWKFCYIHNEHFEFLLILSKEKIYDHSFWVFRILHRSHYKHYDIRYNRGEKNVEGRWRRGLEKIPVKYFLKMDIVDVSCNWRITKCSTCISCYSKRIVQQTLYPSLVEVQMNWRTKFVNHNSCSGTTYIIIIYQ